MGGVHLHSGGGSGGWFGYLRVTDEKPAVIWSLLKRVLSRVLSSFMNDRRGSIWLDSLK